MDNNQHIEKKIKDSFEQIKSAAPKDLWGGISDQFKTPDPDSNLDKRVKESFEIVDAKAPGHVWNNVSRQLNIDLVWKRTKRVLDIRTKVRKWSRAAALLLLLLLPGLVGYYYFVRPDTSHSGSYAEGTQPESVETAEKKLNGSNNHDFSVDDLQKSTEKEGYFENSILKDSVETAVLSPVSEATIANHIHKGSKDVTYSKRRESRNKKTSLASIMDFIRANDDSVFIQKGSISKITPKTIALILYTNDNIRELALLPVDNTDSDTGTTTIYRTDIGLIGVLNNTWLINNETKNGLRSESLVKTHPTFASSYGLIFNFKLDSRNVIATEMFIHSAIHQHYNLYQEGKYLSKDIDLEFYKFGLLYQRNVLQHGRLIPSNYTMKIGGYLAYLKEKSKIIDGRIVSVSDDYDDFDYGFKIAAGQEKTFNRIILGYGIVSEIGVHNIFSGNEKTPSDFDLTRNRSIGAYLSLRYKL